MGEPLPLKREYPDDGQTAVDFRMRVAALLCGMGGIFGLLLFSSLTGTKPPLFYFLYFVVIVVLVVSLVFYSSKVGAWQKRREWKRAFEINNADLGIDYRAVSNMISYMKEHTRYRCLDFENVVIHLASALRHEEIFTTFAKEVFETYEFFIGKRADYPRTYCPK